MYRMALVAAPFRSVEEALQSLPSRALVVHLLSVLEMPSTPAHSVSAAKAVVAARTWQLLLALAVLQQPAQSQPLSKALEPSLVVVVYRVRACVYKDA